MALTATTGRLLSLEEVQDAFVQRSKALVTADFVGTYAASCKSAVDEAAALVRLCENVTGAANKRAAGRWLSACVGALRFETEQRGGPPNLAAQRLAALAVLQKGSAPPPWAKRMRPRSAAASAPWPGWWRRMRGSSPRWRSRPCRRCGDCPCS
ncbi:hypothetical protein [Brevundimonas denitrificans]|uniref:hypothetical protein n=1 Tax=Brevundimonas denitrificans TaxID=1443434 RepID=UPI00223BB2B7|nr:hypothetical protein [Brevundimonas denitrificans]